MFYQTLVRYGSLLGALAVVAMASQYSQSIFSLFHHGSEPELLIIFFMIAVIFGLSFGIFYLASGTVLPSFVVAIFFGMAARPLLQPVIESHALLSALVGFGATLILFGGGLETTFSSFRKRFMQISSLAFIGLMVTAIFSSYVIWQVSSIAGNGVGIPVALLLGAILASTDPAAIIPILKYLRFQNPAIKDLIISESAVTDVTGTLLTVALLTTMSAGIVFSSLADGYASLLSEASILLLGKQLVFGIGFGVIGYLLLEFLIGFKASHFREYEADSAFFLFIPILVFTVALALGGSGYLAAFIAGLLFRASDQLHETERFFNHMIDGFFKPVIFLLLGALVDLRMLMEYAGIGIVFALLFMFVIRPVAVFISLSPFVFFGKEKMNWRELLFISFIRETGAIPAVLLVTVVGSGFAHVQGLVPIGMWVILLTLMIEPPLTSWAARCLGVAEAMKDEDNMPMKEEKSLVVLVTRGYSWMERLPKVIEWMGKHGVRRLKVLICLEDRYEPVFSHSIELLVAEQGEKINAEQKKEGKDLFEITAISRKGLLEENIKEIAEHHAQVMAIFVGRKMLDFRLKEIHSLKAPLYFMD